METKKCISCRVDKDLQDFAKSSKASQGRQDVCRICMSEYRKEHYKANPEYYKNKTKEARRRRKIEREDFKKDLKCQVCGESRWWVLEFHHRDPGQKQYTIGRHSTRSIKKMIDEIKKCDVLCANCHKDKHYQERNGSDRY